MPSRAKTITQCTIIAATPAQVYDAFVNARVHSAFTGARATGSARVGSRFTAWGGYISGVHRVLVKGRRLVQDWQTSEWPEGADPSRVEFSFKAVKGGTKIRMVHSNVPAEQAGAYRQGWIEYYWTPMAAYFARVQRSAHR
jgi:activator of HSP90 ATPase